jgi:hypothetical protein
VCVCVCVYVCGVRRSGEWGVGECRVTRSARERGAQRDVECRM